MDKLEEIKKLKNLLDDGIINEEDFAREKAELLGINTDKTKDEEQREVLNKEENKSKSKSLEEYERELMEQNKAKEALDEKEKLKVKTIPNAVEDRDKIGEEQKENVNKGVTKAKRIFKWILTVMLWLFVIGSFGAAAESGWVMIPSGIIMLILGFMACPKITDITQSNSKFDVYTKHKTLIVWILVILWIILINAFPVKQV